MLIHDLTAGNIRNNKIEKWSKNILNNYRFFYDKLTLDNIELIFKNSLKIVVYAGFCDDGDDPFLIFESLNDTGKPMEPHEKIRGYLLLDSDESEHKELYYKYWKPMEDLLNTDATFKRFCEVYVKFNTKTLRTDGADLYLRFKSYVEENELNKEYVLKDMCDTCMIYSKLYRSKYSASTGINEVDICLNFLNSMKQFITLPIILELYSNHLSGNISKENFIECIKYLESISFRLWLSGVEPAKFYKNNLKLSNIDYNNPTYVFKQLMNHKHVSSDEKFIKDLNEIGINYSTKTAPVCVNHLLRIENQHHPNEIVTSAQVSIEHRLPQNIENTEWEKEFGENKGELHERNLGKLGNISIIHQRDNSACKNNGWGIKKPIYENSHYYLNSDASELDNWTEKTIDDRTKEIVYESLMIFKRKSDVILGNSFGRR